MLEKLQLERKSAELEPEIPRIHRDHGRTANVRRDDRRDGGDPFAIDVEASCIPLFGFGGQLPIIPECAGTGGPFHFKSKSVIILSRLERAPDPRPGLPDWTTLQHPTRKTIQVWTSIRLSVSY